MPVPEIDLGKIRQHDGSQARAFEELCCQLAALEPRPEGAVFHRKGAGADAGVECFLRLADGSETGWQVKFHRQLNGDLVASLDDSLDTALWKHPGLDRYVVCLRLELSDARTGKGPSPLKRWEDWKAAKEASAHASGRRLQIELWDGSAIRERLGRDDPMYSGRALYWFDTEVLTQAWFRQRLGKSVANLGRRYTAETSIDLPIRQSLLSLARDPFLNRGVTGWHHKLAEHGGKALHALGRLGSGIEDVAAPLATALNDLLAGLAAGPWLPDAPFPIDRWTAATNDVSAAVSAAWRYAWDLRGSAASKEGQSAVDSAVAAISRLSETLGTVADELRSQPWQLANAGALLVHGGAGQGKSHLLADAAAYQVGRGRPAILLLGSAFTDAEPWRQVIQELDLPPHYQARHLLGALDAAAEAAGSRAFLIIDALNERHGLDIWPHRLAGLLADIARYKRIVPVVSCRSTYLAQVLPPNLGEDALPRIEHTGFRVEDATAYLQARGFVLPGMPSPAPELLNPLFLKTCCDGLERSGKREFPKGLAGITAVFDLYTGAAIDAVNRRLRLTPYRRILERALDALAKEILDSGSGTVAVERAAEVLDAIWSQSSGSLETDLLFQLEAEGLIGIEPTPGDTGNGRDVRFSFERYGDHRAARRLIDDHLDTSDPMGSFQPGKPLGDFLSGRQAWRRAGVVEALAVQLPERAGLEILDVPTGGRNQWVLQQVFMQSLLARDPASFTARTMELVRDMGDDLEFRTLLAVATEPANRFNAAYLHDLLSPIPMPQRDAGWSAWLAEEWLAEDGPARTLVGWALASGFGPVDEARADLACTALGWLLGNSNRAVRDRATKALAALLAPRLTLAPGLLERFSGVDDPYIQERLLCACYGAVLQGSPDTSAVSALALDVYRRLFEGGAPPANALIRDHGRGIIEYAAWRRCLPKEVDLPRCRPPYKSPWPLEHVPDSLINGFQRTYGPSYRGTDEIVRSCVDDGDFARYVIDRHLGDWSPAPLGTGRLPTDKDLALAWCGRFAQAASGAALAALAAFMEAMKAAEGQGPRADTPERKACRDAEVAFREVIGPDAWEEYRTQAQPWWGQGMFQRWPTPGRPAHLNLAWARRWVCKRAHELGWSEDLHGDFDRTHGTAGRMDHRVERIGKKYQWLALYELRARMADNLAYIGSDGGRYEGEWQGSLRDLDPSMLVTKTGDDGWEKSWDATWWSPIAPTLGAVDPVTRVLWRDSADDVIDGPGVVEVVEPGTGDRWLTLHAFRSVTQWAVRDGDRQMERDTWSRVSCLVLPKGKVKAFLKKIRGRTLTSPHDFPHPEFHGGHTYLGEYPWHPSFGGIGDDHSDDGAIRRDRSGWRPTVVKYRCERGGYDYSLDETVSFQLPAPWLIQGLGLTLENGKRPRFVGADGRTVFFDPSVDADGPSAALVRRDVFLGFLEREGLAAIWSVAGEKGVSGGQSHGRAFGGRQVFTSLYRLDGSTLARETHVETEFPRRDNVEELLGGECPPGIMAVALGEALGAGQEAKEA